MSKAGIFRQTASPQSDRQLIDVVDLAARSAEEVASIAAPLSTRLHAKNRMKHPSLSQTVVDLGKLSGHLQSVSYILKRHDDEEYSDFSKSHEKLDTLLESLEVLCTGKLSEDSYSVLERLMRPGSETFAKRKQAIEASLSAFVSHEIERTRLLKWLKRFSKAKQHAEKQAASQSISEQAMSQIIQNGKVNDDDDYSRHVHETLYQTLRKYTQCCASQLSSKSHWGRLQLNSNYSSSEDEIRFWTVFAKKSSAELLSEVEWQHLQFSIPRQRYKSKSVGFDEPKATEEVQRTTKRNTIWKKIADHSEFCTLLQDNFGTTNIDIRVANEILHVLGATTEDPVDIADERSLSLADVLNERHLVPRDQFLIAYYLARSIWQFYDSGFMSVRWTVESIHLFRKRSNDDDSEPGLVSVPYFALSFNQATDEDAVERLKPGVFRHLYPRILALGDLLYELGRPRPAKQSRWTLPNAKRDAPSTIESFVNDTVDKIKRGIENKRWPSIKLMDIETLEKYKRIVSNCVDPELFKLIQISGTQGNPVELEEMLTVEERRAILYRKIVKPLKELLVHAGWINESGIVQNRRQMNAVSKTANGGISDDHIQSQLLGSSGSGPEISHANTQGHDWLTRIKNNNCMGDLVSGYRTKALKDRRLRITVLDTGYDQGAVFFVNKERRCRLKLWKDYTESASIDPTDEDGHGTHVLSVLMNTAPAADIYVARVARNSDGLRVSAEKVADAIKWAWNECKADIVTMSFGFNGEKRVGGQSVISNAISEALTATNQSILFFAAASNDGGNGPEMFPATHRNVLSIRATDYQGYAARFNPPAPNQPGFMTLGIDVPGACLQGRSDFEVCLSGTSCATPIAAGYAAILLGYARMHEVELNRRLGGKTRLSNLQNMNGMSILFERLAKEMTTNLLYLNPIEFTEKSHEWRLSTLLVAAEEAS